MEDNSQSPHVRSLDHQQQSRHEVRAIYSTRHPPQLLHSIPPPAFSGVTSTHPSHQGSVLN